MKKGIIYIHGKGGCASEADHYRALFPDCDVVGFDYRSDTPWAARTEFREFYIAFSNEHAAVSVIANSIGAYFCLHALKDLPIEQALFISPIVDMESLISNMMTWVNVTEADLESRETIETPFGETLTWSYLTWVRSHPIHWSIPTRILYGENDNMQSIASIRAFADSCKADLTIMPNGEHWFHTDEQMNFLDSWILNRR